MNLSENADIFPNIIDYLDVAKFRKKVQDCNNLSFLTKLLELCTSLSNDLSIKYRTEEIYLLSELIDILKKRITEYSGLGKETKRDIHVPVMSLFTWLLLHGENREDVEDFFRSSRSYF